MKQILRHFIFYFCLFQTAFFYAQTDSVEKSKINVKDTSFSSEEIPALGEIFKPSIGLGTGLFSYYGDLYSKHAQSPWTSRIAYELNISQPLNSYLHLNFYALFGKLGANERLDNRQENFQSEIRLGGANVSYDFNHFYKTDNYQCRPWISLGFEGFEFLTKTDLYDKYGNRYYYWADGSIRNLAENDPNAGGATLLVRDYVYESDVRELNRDGFGKYQERSWAIPIGAGFYFKITDRVKLKMGTTFHMSFTDYIDGVSHKSNGDRAGTKAKDNFVMTSFSLNYDLVFKRKDDTLPADHYDNVDFLALDMSDEDGDGVKDFDDECHKSPKGCKVDKKGCPVDEDNDMIGDCLDDELPTPKELFADGKGVGMTDQRAQQWYDEFYDSTGVFAKLVDLDSAIKTKPVKTESIKKVYTVELAKFKGGIESDVMAFLLSIGDVQSVDIDGNTVVYTAGTYEDVKLAKQRRDEFLGEGLKDAKVGYFMGEQYFTIEPESELTKEIDNANPNLTNNGTNSITPELHGIIYRVQLGAYKHKLSPSLFKNAGEVIELKTPDGYFKYVSKAYKSLNEAAVHKAELSLEGYGDAFVAAYKDGKRISLSEAGATYENKNEAKNEILDESKNTGSAIDKNLVVFKVQLGGLKKTSDNAFEERTKDLKDVEKQLTVTGLLRFTCGSFNDYEKAISLKNKLSGEGFADAFVIATFKGELISIQEALELMGNK